MKEKKITEVKTTRTVTLTLEKFEKLMLEAVDHVVIKDDPRAFIATSLVAVKAVKELEKLIFDEED